MKGTLSHHDQSSQLKTTSQKRRAALAQAAAASQTANINHQAKITPNSKNQGHSADKDSLNEKPLQV